MTLIGLAPLTAWLIGSGIVLAAPPVYQSSAMIRVEVPDGNPAALRREAAKLKSDSIVKPATRALTPDGRAPKDPMAEYALWTSLTVTEQAGPNLIKVAARGSDPGEARRKVLAVAQAYEQSLGEAAQQRLIYVDPPEASPARVADDTRMMLGVAGFAVLGLLLSIPLLRHLEQTMPLRSLALPLPN
ncbi:hypothetical protein [Luteolibacter marinus]|uniref:hypothetical protein n=1 Tax=Luteolibacter marinus TaxID=2776705 RepID=UPI001D005558|nr:hypothetical protein [Luteolibacter marinus]